MANGNKQITLINNMGEIFVYRVNFTTATQASVNNLDLLYSVFDHYITNNIGFGVGFKLSQEVWNSVKAADSIDSEIELINTLCTIMKKRISTVLINSSYFSYTYGISEPLIELDVTIS